MASSINTNPNLAKTRIVCLSDTHSASPKDGAFKLPKGDVLIHAGDLTNQGTYAELKRTVDWIAAADFEVKIIVAGNHDITLDAAFYKSHRRSFHSQHPESSPACLELLAEAAGIVYLNHTSTTIRLTAPTGPRTTFRVFGSPYSPTVGNWAFSYPPCPSGRISSTLSSSTARDLWSAIPLDTDAVVTHTPAAHHLDLSPKWSHAGCPALHRRLWQIRPLLHVCGHVHEGRGVEIVRWGLDASQPGREEGTTGWSDPALGSRGKESRVDLTGRRTAAQGNVLGRPIENDCSDVALVAPVQSYLHRLEGAGGMKLRKKGHEAAANGQLRELNERGQMEGVVQNHVSFSGVGESETRTSSLHHEYLSAWTGREGRKETCTVNAAIMARSFGMGAKRYNQPIVIEVDLPTWETRKDSEHAEVPSESAGFERDIQERQ
ncbi:Ring assembly protein 3 [Sphaceloma murrayae]|uniref:Ring assembly protein 3 n=1 Tax=Sphaceloma murrayae TaxID=2082308 RepID=A0A2K1QYB6_9PEZI|nr:Ring assembly protein 3 [Sphaceloma murrayae]